MAFDYDLCVVGGCGRVGLPLALCFAAAGLQVSVHDINQAAVAQVNGRVMPFQEDGAQPVLNEVLGKNLTVADDPDLIRRSAAVVVVIGTPVDEHLNPQFGRLTEFFDRLSEQLVDGHLIVLRSTLFPGSTDRLARLLNRADKKVHVSFCPERIAEGKGMEELRSLPQIVSGCSEEAYQRASQLFSVLTQDIIPLKPFEAELAKLFTNSWRYIQFAAANQFYMMAQDFNADFYRIYDAMRYRYPRTEGFPKAGFAAGPCLFKDTMQLASFNNNNFMLGHSAMLINEGLPNFVVDQLRRRRNLAEETVGILGMAFKANVDDGRESLSYKLRKVLQFECRRVLCHDPVMTGEDHLVDLEQLYRDCQVLILGTPHKEYKELKIPPHIEVVDVWNFLPKENVSESIR
ncbi:MAG: nucleotide sugar dehydrogenase [Candidatus Eremiobacteraeota bacterium]|nr:nucleotide sugar dehydrogenase [Candidatus Eremiobacteraeota bacterium]